MIEETDLSESKNSRKLPPIFAFFILSFVITWGFTFLFIYPLNFIYQMRSYDSFIGIMCVIAVGMQSFGPIFAAIITISIYNGKKGMKEFGKRLVNFKVKYYWYLCVLLLPVIVYSIPIIGNIILGNLDSHSVFNVSSWGINASVIIINIIYAGIAEEPGWRGYAVPEMNKRFRPIVSGAIIGVIWAIWHLLLYIYGGRSWKTFPQFVFTVTVISCIYVWIYMKTESIPLMVIFHVMHNLSNRVYINYLKPYWGGVIYLIVLLIIIYFDRKTLLNIPGKIPMELLQDEITEDI